MNIQPADQPAAVHPRSRVAIAQRDALATSGWLALLLVAGCVVACVLLVNNSHGGTLWLPILLAVLILQSLIIVPPGQTQVVQFFGRYIGTVRRPGFWWVSPLCLRIAVSIKVRNFETAHLKVNDADGNPVEIAAIVVWQVADTAKATYAVDNYTDFIAVQAEAALRHVATSHPYDNAVEGGTTLRGSTDVVARELAREVSERVSVAGLEVVEVRISHLAYSPEIAQAMLRRQQANAVVAARSRIVEGAVGMVELALERLNQGGVVRLDDERTATMVSNLMVVLCSDQPASPIVNAGSLYP